MIPLCRTPYERGEHELLKSKLLASRIQYRETDGNFLSEPTVWVNEADFDRARHLFEQCIAEYSAAHSSRRRPRIHARRRRYPPWQVWRSSSVTLILALVMMLGMFAVYPLLVALGLYR
jgi:hypothetical protein